jgi:hypothetical protein
MLIDTRNFKKMQVIPVARKSRPDHSDWVKPSQENCPVQAVGGKGNRINRFGVNVRPWKGIPERAAAG